MPFLTANDRYIGKLVLVPMIGTFVLAASLLILDKMLRLFDFVATEGGPVGVVFKMLANLIPEYAGLAIPLGLMMGILLAFRKLATSSELDVMRAVGLSYTRLLRVPFIFTFLLAGANLLNVFYLQPLSHYFYEELQYELRSGALGAAIKVGEFTTLKDRVALRIEESADNGRKLSGIFARVANDKGQVLAISAKEGQFLANRESPDTIILRLTDGQIVQDGPKIATPRVLTFSSHDLPIDLPKIEQFRQRGGKDKEYILPELLRLGWSKATPVALRNETQASFNYRMVEVVMMLLLPLLAVALAIPPKRSTSALGVFVSIVMVVAYHKVNQYASDVAALGRIDPLIALWVPFALFAALIVWMYWRVAYVPGGQAIGGLERGFAKVSAAFRKLFGRKRLKDEPALPDLSEGTPLQLEFFPSKTVTLYIAKMFVVRIVAVLAMLVLVLQMLDLLGESGKILEATGNGQAQLWTYVTLRVPGLVQTFLPYSVLLATILTLVQLNQNSEVISMKAAGLSAHQILAPLVLTALVVAAISFSFNERVVTRAASSLKAWQAVQYGKVPSQSAAKSNVWLADGANVLYAQAITGTGAATRMTGVSWYKRDAGGRVIDIVTAPTASYSAPGWRLETPRGFAVQSVKLEKMPAATIVAERITPAQIAISKVDPDAEDIVSLRGSIDAMRAAGRRTGELEGAWWHKISGPLSAALMPLLGAVAAFGLARSGHVLVRAAIGMALGFAFFVVDNAALAMGSLGGYPPLLAAWAPFVLFALIGETVLIRTEE